MTRATWLVVALGAVAPAVHAAQSASADPLVIRASRYAERFVNDLSSVVAEEQYLQRHVGSVAMQQTRTLTSDILLARLPNGDWQVFRDVAVVDGRPVRDRQARLTTLVLSSSRAAVEQAEAIGRESARFNLPEIGTLNNPLLVMAFLQPRYQTRFRFRSGSLDPAVGSGIRVVSFVEQERPSLLRTMTGGDLLASGRLWIEEGSGRVVRTELSVLEGRSRVTTTFARDPGVAIDVPVTMEERYRLLDGGFITGSATYGQFRRFTVQTQETVR